MKRKTVLATGLVVALAAAVSVPVLAHGTGGWGMSQGNGYGAMMNNDGNGGPRGRGHARGTAGGGHGMMGGGRGMGGGMMGMMSRRGGMMAGGPGMMGAMMKQFDVNGDGTVTPDELRSGLQRGLTKYDADGDGTLSLDEFAALYAALTRRATVRHFQALDVNGDGKVTPDEITAPADRFERMQKVWQSRQGGDNN